MQRRQAIGFIGAALLCIGVFMPIISAPIIGSITYFNNGKGDGLFVLILGGVSAFIVLLKFYKVLWVTAFLTLALLIIDFLSALDRLSEMSQKMEREMANNPFAGLGKAMVDSVQLQWGWIVLAAGVICLIVCAAMPKDYKTWL